MKRRHVLTGLGALLLLPRLATAAPTPKLLEEVVTEGRGRARYRRDAEGVWTIEVEVIVEGTTGVTLVFEKARLNPKKVEFFDLTAQR